jgi:hypothetical protein
MRRLFVIPPSILLCLCILTAAPALASDPPKRPDIEEVKKTFAEEGPFADRVKAGVALGFWEPDELAKILDEMVKEQKPRELEVLAKVAVQTKVRHVRLLLGYAISQYGEAGTQALRDRIDNDYPHETVRAIGLLGFLGDPSVWSRLLELIRSENERVGVMAARALARIGTKSQAAELIEVGLTVDNRHVRTHIAWAVQDLLGKKKAALTAFGKFQRQRGAMGARAKEMMAVLMDEISPPQKYKAELADVREFFTPKRGVRIPPLKAPKDHRERIQKVLEAMKERVPAYYHLICTTVDLVEVSSSDYRFDHKRGAINLRYADLIKWDRDELLEYYMVRYATIVCLAKMGDPTQGHRGWEEGMIDGWWYAMDHTLIALPEQLDEFVKQFLRAPPW